jgi:hypothetical protein
MQQIEMILTPTNGRAEEYRHLQTRYTRHEVAAPREVGPPGRTKNLPANKRWGRCK